MGFQEDLQLMLQKFPELEKSSKIEQITAVNIFNIIKASQGKVDKNLFKVAYESKNIFNLNNINDYYYLVFRAMRKTNPMKKIAYPILQGALSEEPPDEYDLDKWADLVYKIYDAVENDEMSFVNALDYYSGFLDSKTGEDLKFKRWVEYYKNGEHLKYNNDNGDSMKKEADFQFPLSGPGFYPSHFTKVKENKEIFDSKRDKANKEQDYNDWKQKLHAAIRRIDKLLRSSDEYLDSETHRDLADLLHNFDMEVRRIRLESTASDLAFRAADNFKKLGFSEGSEILSKFAQETAIPDEVITPEEIEPPDIAEEVPVAEEAQKGPSGALNSAPGPEPGEYEQLAGEVTLDMATTKLEDIAGRLADRRTIRLLAEFDIMLDKIGIAAMFPELAESQSKLIDAYSYSLSRVTKMLGMLSSGRSLSEISSARADELDANTQKEVNKTFEGGAAKPDVGKGTEAIQEEFGTETPVEPPEIAPTPGAPA